ncbi:MAG TPA: L-serine ammonia-lyase, iron-sulfur-dependent, subunit alpha [Thermotogota bacterium]|nr:L-serine ammonia-lyase, iron-sulfur-dependent, subunit alpha [Thermotogota bacterium]
MTFNGIKQMASETKLPLHEAALVAELSETGNNPEETRAQLGEFLRVILEESEKQYGKVQETLTGLTGTNAKKVFDRGVLYHSPFTHVAIVASLSICESNASMGRVVACPTAGASGVIPGVFYALAKENEIPFDHLLPGYILASAIGNVIATKATLAGAAGGCQAEIGSAAAMAAGALAYLSGGDAEMVDSAAALVLKSLLGLVCDPVGGFVEVPCVKRNAIAVTAAISAAELALSGVSSVIPFDETVDAMRRIGRMLPMELRETGLGGLATTPTAKKAVGRILTRFQKS